VFLILAGWVYVQSHQPILRGKLELPILETEVEVYYDEYGIPHIYAQNAADAYRAFGYVHAQDRLFQMDLMRRVGAGTLSELLGSETKKTDAFFRTIGTNRKALADAAKFDELPENVKNVMTAYLEGVNHYVATGKHPLEYTVLRAEPDSFQIVDMYATMGYMAYSFAYALRTDPLVEHISNKLGADYLRSLDLAVTNDLLTPDTIRQGIDEGTDSLGAVALIRPYFPEELAVPTLQGSNAWAIGPKNTLSGKVMLSNDIHIKYSAPGTWYEAHIEYPGFGLYGNYLSGIPFALVGHSRSHAWGLTMFEDDDSDFFVERFSEPDSSETFYRDSLTKKVNKYKEIISVKGEADTSLTVYETAHGVIINDHLPIAYEKPVSMYWNFTALENELPQAVYQMNRADNIAAFAKGLSKIHSPGLNITYGDASGNIAHWSASKLIDRPDSSDGKHYAKGFSSAYEFEGYLDFERNPQIVNPEKGYVCSANQMHDTTHGVLYPGYYAPDTRAERIDLLLSGLSNATVENIQEVILDNVSTTEANVAHEIVKILRNSDEVFTDLEEEALEEMGVWLGNHNLPDVKPTIYYKTLFYILRGAMQDELGEEAFEKLFTTHLLKRSWPKLISDQDSPWWDNLKTSEKIETRELVVVKAFKKSIMELEDELGSDLNNWTWERVHSLQHPHVFSSVSVLKEFFHIGPFPSPGGIETINNGSFLLNGNGEYSASYGPAMRIILDFADIENAVSILPAGNSGNVMSPHYSDQAEMYVRGGFRKMKMNKQDIQTAKNHLILTPQDKE
jgi:penicillin amidase